MGVIEEHGQVEHPHFFGKKMHICDVLNALAAGENCDGEPYDTMQDAATYIRHLETQLTMWRDFHSYATARLEAQLREHGVEPVAY